ncbi:MAG: anthrone oxygenase family protein [Cyclobacteriaceae bacterium]
MELSIRSFVLLGAVVLTGLSAGFFYAWSVSVIPGTQKITDASYLETMQSINSAILNPAFFSVFFGSILFLIAASAFEFNHGMVAFWLMFSATFMYLIGTLCVTGLGNVPLNDQLDALNLSELATTQMKEFRNFYETKWNYLHQIRTVCAVISFLLATLSILFQTNK